MHFTNCTTRKLLFHNRYDSYGWTDAILVSGCVHWTWMTLAAFGYDLVTNNSPEKKTMYNVHACGTCMHNKYFSICSFETYPLLFIQILQDAAPTHCTYRCIILPFFIAVGFLCHLRMENNNCLLTVSWYNIFQIFVHGNF